MTSVLKTARLVVPLVAWGLWGPGGAFAGATDCVPEAEPDDAVETAMQVDLARCVSGTIAPGDQDILRFATAAPALWTFSLTGVDGDETRLDLFEMTGDPAAPGGRLYTQVATDRAGAILLPAGQWMAGISIAGDWSGAWTLTARPEGLGADTGAAPLAPDAAVIGMIAPGSAQSIPLTITAAMARKRWDLVLDIPPGSSFQLGLEGPQGHLADRTLVAEGPVHMGGIGLDPGAYTVTLAALTVVPVPFRLGLAPEGPRIRTREDEPNDTAASARGLAAGKPVQGSLATPGDTDLWAFEVTGAIAQRLLTLSARVPASGGAPAQERARSGEDGASRTLCLKSADGSDLQCRTGADVMLGDLVLPVGRYLVSVDGPQQPQASYELALRAGPRPTPGHETEPDDSVEQAFALPPGTPVQGRFAGQEADRYALVVTGDPQLWRVEVTGATRLRLEDPQGVQIAQRDTIDPGDTLAVDDVLLTTGRYVLLLEGVDTAYAVTARPRGPPPEGAESEPNDDAVIANLIRPGQVRRGRLGDAGDADTLRFTLRQDARLRLTIGIVSGDSAYVSLRGPQGEVMQDLTPGEFTFPDDFPAGNYTLMLRSSAPDVVGWQVGLDWVNPFGAGDLAVESQLGLDVQALASHLPQGQRLTGRMVLTNRGNAPVTLALSGQSVVPGAEIVADPASVTLAAGVGQEVAVSAVFPPDLGRDDASLIALRAMAADGRFTTAEARIRILPEALPAAAFVAIAPPVALRGGFNLAAPGFGATVRGETIDTADRQTDDNPKWLFDGLAGTQGFQGVTGQSVRVDFGPDMPVPVAGFALTPQADTGGYGPLQLRGFEVALSADGVTFVPVLRASLGAYPTETYFPLPAPVAARAAELRFLSGSGPGSEGEGQPAYLAEWKVIAVPGQPAGLAVNIADPRRGGHVVRLDPQTIGLPTDLEALLTPGGAGEMVDGGQAARLVIGFADDRAAQIAAVDWVDDPAIAGANPSGGQDWGEIAVSLGDTPVGPWVRIGSLVAPTTPGGPRHLALDAPARGRFMQLAASPVAVAPADGWLLPAEIRVTEAIGTAAAPSVAGEWGLGSNLSGADLADAPVLALSDDPDEADSPASPRPLGWGGGVAGRVTLGQDEDYWAFTAPAGESRALVTLSGDPAVLAGVTAAGADGVAVPLRHVPPEPRARRFEMPVVAGKTYVLHVTEPPRSIVVAVDVSGSLQPFWDAIRLALGAFAEAPVPGRDFLRFLPFDADFASPDWTDQPDVMRRTLATLTALTTGSGLEPTTITAAQALAGRDGLRALVLLTDAATPGFGDRSRMWSELEGAGLQVFAGKIGDLDDQKSETRLMQDVAAVGGGFYAGLQTQAELDVILERAIDWLRRPARYGLTVGHSDLPPPEPGHLSVGIAAAGGSAPAAADPVPPVDSAVPVQAGVRPSVELIIDASGSMLAVMAGGRRKIDVAHDVLDDLIRNRIPEGTPVALRAFGDTAEGSCDTALRAPLMPVVPDYLAPIATGITPVNLAKTPIAAALAATAGDLAAAQGPRVVVLVTDGEETCGGDPEAAIAGLRAAGVAVTVNIVGFALDDAALAATFAQWAATGGGQYFAASDAETLKTSLAQATAEHFAVLGPDGAEVASGLVGGPSVTVPAGRWRVVVGNGRAEFAAVDLGEGERRALELPQD